MTDAVKNAVVKRFLDRDPDELKDAIEASIAKRADLQKKNEGDFSYEAQIYMPKLEDGRLQMHLYDVIDDWWGCGPTGLVEVLQTYPEVPVDLYINSPGGGVYDARAISAQLKRREVTAYIDGICASAATTISLAAKERIMQDGAQFMVHRCWMVAAGNKNDFEKYAGECEVVDNDIAKDYAAVTGKSTEEMLKLMDDETYLNAEQARELGFCNTIAANEPPKLNTTDEQQKDGTRELLAFLSKHRKH